MNEGGEKMAGLIEKSLLLGLGVATLTRDKVVQFVNKLVEEGEVKAEEAPNIIEKLVARGKENREELRKLVQEELDKLHISTPLASREDIEALSQKIDDLSAKIEELASEKPEGE
jgi:polyhydroxyalkanoate synthesis regulator phasin